MGRSWSPGDQLQVGSDEQGRVSPTGARTQQVRQRTKGKVATNPVHSDVPVASTGKLPRGRQRQLNPATRAKAKTFGLDSSEIEPRSFEQVDVQIQARTKPLQRQPEQSTNPTTSRQRKKVASTGSTHTETNGPKARTGPKVPSREEGVLPLTAAMLYEDKLLQRDSGRPPKRIATWKHAEPSSKRQSMQTGDCTPQETQMQRGAGSPTHISHSGLAENEVNTSHDEAETNDKADAHSLFVHSDEAGDSYEAESADGTNDSDNDDAYDDASLLAIDDDSGSTEDILQRLRRKLLKLNLLAANQKSSRASEEIGKVSLCFHEIFDNSSEPTGQGFYELPVDLLRLLRGEYESIRQFFKSTHDGMPLIRNAFSKNVLPLAVPHLMDFLQLLLCFFSKTIGGRHNIDSLRQQQRLKLTGVLVQGIIKIAQKPAKKSSVQEPTKPGIQEVRNRILPRMNEFQKKLAALYQEIEDSHGRYDTQARQAQALEQQMRREQERDVVEERLKRSRKVRAKWQYLHVERYHAHGFISGSRDSAHLMPHKAGTDLDQDMREFVRVAVFRERQGPLPKFVEQARLKEWQPQQLEALGEGLREHCGPLLFERIMRQHCKPGGLMHEYNVTEIVVMAAWLREELVKSQSAMSSEVEEWVRKIPIWTEESGLRDEDLQTHDKKAEPSQ